MTKDHEKCVIVCLNVLIINYCLWFVSELVQEVFPHMTRASINMKIAEMLKPYNTTRKDIQIKTFSDSIIHGQTLCILYTTTLYPTSGSMPKCAWKGMCEMDIQFKIKVKVIVIINSFLYFRGRIYNIRLPRNYVTSRNSNGHTT